MCVDALTNKILDLGTVEDAMLGLEGPENIYLTKILPSYVSHGLRPAKGDGARPIKDYGAQPVNTLPTQQVTRKPRLKQKRPVSLLSEEEMDMFLTELFQADDWYAGTYTTLYDTEMEFLPKVPTNILRSLHLTL